MNRLMNGANLGAFRILHQIGEGGMAKVYKAFQPSMERYVALKVLPSQLAEDPQFVERFIREARTIAQLEHKNILPVYDFGEQNGITYLAMRFVEGGTLKELLSKGRLTLHDILDLMSQVCPALDYAHRRGVIHRDVKPSNVILDSEGAAYLTDFGIAKVVGVSGDLTATGAAIGTPAYMAPEQALGNSVDARTDIYALGVMLYEMVAGRVPFQADTPMAVLMAHLHEPLPLPSQINPSIPQEVEAVIIKSLAKEPGDRYQTAIEMVSTLRQAVESSASLTVASTLVTLIQEVRENRTIPKAGAPLSDPRLRQRMEQDYIDGLSAYWVREWEKARGYFESVLAIDPHYKDAASRLQEVQNQIHLAERYAQAQAEIARNDWQAARQVLQQVVSLEKDYKDASDLLIRVTQQLELAGLYSQADQLSKAGQWQAILKIFERIHALEPDHPDPQDLFSQATESLVEIERLEKVKTTYEQGLQALESGNWHQAETLFEQVTAQQPGYGQTVKLLQRARDEQSKTLMQTAAVPEPGAQVESDQTIAVPGPAPQARKPIKSIPRRIALAAAGIVLVAAVVMIAILLINRTRDRQAVMAEVTLTQTRTPSDSSLLPATQAQEIIQSSHLHGPGEEMVDDFQNAPDGMPNPDLWTVSDGCQAFGGPGSFVQDGVLQLANQTSEEELSCQFWLFRGERFPGALLWPFEARMRFDGEFGYEGSTQWLTMMADYDESMLRVDCGLRTSNGQVFQEFGVWETVQGNENRLFEHYSPIESFRWVTTRLQINPDTLAFECFFEDELFAEFKHPDEGLVREIPFARLLDTERLPGAAARSLVDEMTVYPPQGEAAQPQAEAVEDCQGEILGWRTEFWDNPDLSGDPVRCFDSPAVEFNWKSGGPFQDEYPVDNFSMRFSRIMVFEPGLYSFHVIADDGVRMWLDGEIVIDRWNLQPPTEFTFTKPLEGEHRLDVEYFDGDKDAQISLFWRPLPRIEGCFELMKGIIVWVDGDMFAPLSGAPEYVLHGATQDAGLVGSGFRFNPAGWEENQGSFIEIPVSPEISAIQQFTVETWIYLNPESPQVESEEKFVVLPMKFLFRKIPPGNLNLTAWTAGEEHQLFSPMMLPRGQWFHAAATYDGQFLRLYLNGRMVQEEPAQGELSPADHLWFSNPSQPLDGMLDEVTIYGRALNEEEILLLYAVRQNGKCKH